MDCDLTLRMVGIVILNYNNSQQTIACVRTLVEHCAGASWKLCIVDNASRTEQYSKLLLGMDELKVEAEIIRSEVNGGYARGNDLGCEYFAGDPQVDNILILNDDTRFTMDILSPMEAYLEAHPECGVVFPVVLSPDGQLDRACFRRQKTTRDLFLQATSLPKFLGLRRTEFLPGDPRKSESMLAAKGVFLVPPGSCMMLPKDIFARIGYLDPGTFLYFEEHILSEKLRREGKESAILPELSIIHLGAQTTARQSAKAIYKYWRQSYLYFVKNYSNLSRAAVLYLSLRTHLASLFK